STTLSQSHSLVVLLLTIAHQSLSQTPLVPTVRMGERQPHTHKPHTHTTQTPRTHTHHTHTRTHTPHIHTHTHTTHTHKHHTHTHYCSWMAVSCFLKSCSSLLFHGSRHPYCCILCVCVFVCVCVCVCVQ